MSLYIELNNVGQSFHLGNQEINLFSELNLVLNQGESTSLIGPSGAGKSSLLLLLAALEKPSTGNVALKNQETTLPINQLKTHSGFIFQQFHLLPELDAVNNIALPLKLRGQKNALEIAHHWIEKVELKDRAKHKPTQLSGGEQQRIAIARALCTEPAFIFADEPTGNLDQDTADHIADLLFDLIKNQNSALALVTHNPELAVRCQHQYRLNQGKLECLTPSGGQNE